MARKRMTEEDVTKTARRVIKRQYWKGGTVVWHPEARQRDLKRPDTIIIIEYQSQRRQRVIHSVESKVDKRYLLPSDKRFVCDGVKQARLEACETQEDLAKKMEKTRVAISDLERGRVSVNASDLGFIAAYYDKPISYF